MAESLFVDEDKPKRRSGTALRVLAGDILGAYVDARFVADEHFVRRLQKLRDLELQEARGLASAPTASA